MSPTIIEIDHVSRRFGELLAVDDAHFTVSSGELFGLIGHNGAGKSTLFRMILGLLAPSQGHIHLTGKPLYGPAFREIRQQIGYLPENIVLYDNLTGLETLAFFARLKGVPVSSCNALLARVGLAAAAERRVKTYSKGMRQRLGFAQALLGRPRLLLLDEPMSGLDPEGIHAMYALLDEVKADGATIILSSHILAEIEHRVDRIAMMNNGRIVALGPVAELSAAAALPVRVALRLTTASRAHVIRELAAAGWPVRENPSGAVLDIPREDKIRLLSALGRWSTHIDDIQLQEPTLEALFVNHRRQWQETHS